MTEQEQDENVDFGLFAHAYRAALLASSPVGAPSAGAQQGHKMWSVRSAENVFISHQIRKMHIVCSTVT